MRRISSYVFLSSVLWVACGSDGADPVLPYAANLTTIIGDASQKDAPKDRRYREVSTPDGDGCVDEGDDSCAKPQQDCGDDGTADMLVDTKGDPLAVLCYPRSGVAVEEVEGDLSQVGNNIVFVLDDRDDGPDVTGNVTLDGNNVTLYGRGPEVSVIAGDLHIDKNNARVRGIRVQGDVIIDKNNPSLVDCVIEGNLTIHGNNVALGLCEVWGETTIDGNNAVLVENRLASAPAIAGKNTRCEGNEGFADANKSAVIEDSELGAAITCQ